MAYWFAAAAAVSAIASVASGASASRTQRENAKRAQQVAAYNSKQELASGIFNASMITAATAANNAVLMATSKIAARDNMAIANYNADLRLSIANYNAKLLDTEAELIYQAADVDVELIDQEAAKLRGNIVASYGASGAQINDTDSVADAVIDAETNAELNRLVIRHGADIQATKLRNDATRSRWDGLTAAQQIMYEGQMRSQGIMSNSVIQSAGNTIQGTINSTLAYENAKRSASSIFFGGQSVSSEYGAQANTAMVNGYYGAASSAASSYIGYKGASYDPSVANKPSTPPPKTTTPVAPSGQRANYHQSLLE